jgi:hypothetical protein
VVVAAAPRYRRAAELPWEEERCPSVTCGFEVGNQGVHPGHFVVATCPSRRGWSSALIKLNETASLRQAAASRQLAANAVEPWESRRGQAFLAGGTSIGWGRWFAS